MVLATLFASGIYSRFTSLNIFALFFFFFFVFLFCLLTISGNGGGFDV